LAYHGLGEVFVLLFYGLTATCAAYWLQTGIVDWHVLQLSLQTGCLSTILIAINNLRDHVEDRLANKNTLAVRFGVLFGRIEITLLIAVPYLMTFIWIFQYGIYLAILPWITLPIAYYVLKNLWLQTPGKVYNKFFGVAALLVLLFSFCLSISFFLTKGTL
jgi:1,4-dihydroxy-2-naphthoate octaprenyltransferase